FLILVFCFCRNDEILSFRNLSEKQQPLRRHSRAGGNLDLGITAIFKVYKRPVIPAQAGI
ncbi:hypothetical protein, partial [Neisseria meningitidis]|uniref:hypothetical protein n=1 Tax=Neisseria meningitidis TaxID=487 RepID=UPI00053BD32F